MAHMGQETTCMACGKTYIPISSGGGPYSGCPHCKKIEEEEKEADYFAGLDELSTEERIRKIEKWIYHFKSPTRRRDTLF